MLPVLGKLFERRKRAVGKSWRMDETSIKVNGRWTYLYRAADKDGDTVDFLLRAHWAIKRRTRPMTGFQNFRCARILLGGIELMHTIAKGQMKADGRMLTVAEQFYSLSA